MTSELPPPVEGREARIMARIAEDMRVKGRTAEEALGNITDSVRYTVQYPATGYTQGVRADIERLWRKGYTELAVRNCWACGTWKGISTSWREPGGGQLFEVQFHTPQSLAARELTYPAYQRLRDPATSDAERGEIAAYLRQVYAGVPAAHAPPAERARPATGDRPAEHVAYYAISDRYCGDDHPAGALRRIVHEGGQRDEAFGRDLRWRHTFLLYSWERGNLDNTLREIGEDRALRITDAIRRSVTWGVVSWGMAHYPTRHQYGGRM